ncbi:MAG: (deoxy)nucleoside triphosphate pyrophosphohydrolase [Candidatus Izemoplasmataceae bacterium]
MKYIEVVAAVISNEDGLIYCAKRKDEGELALKWEFPGGKIEKGESHTEALKREIMEEFSTEIDVLDFIVTVKHQYKNFHLTMHAYHAKIIKGSMTMNEHTGFKWLKVEELKILDWAMADIPIVDILTK